MFWVSKKPNPNHLQHLIFVEEPKLEALEEGEKTRARIEELEKNLKKEFKQEIELIKVSMKVSNNEMFKKIEELINKDKTK
jgi:hypothetical protein